MTRLGGIAHRSMEVVGFKFLTAAREHLNIEISHNLV